MDKIIKSRLHHRTFTEEVKANAGEVFSKIPLEQIAEIALNLVCSFVVCSLKRLLLGYFIFELKKGYLLGQGTGSIRCICPET